MYKQPELDFDYGELEPYLDGETMEIHYSKHHSTYIKKFNDAVVGTKYDSMDLKEILEDIENVEEKIKTVVRNNGGGAWNHSFYFSILCPSNESGEPEGETLNLINESFESFEEFKKQFSEAALSVFGSGWAWLVVNKKGKLEIVKTSNQDSPISKGLKPILVVDVWEHAYYLKYRNVRADFVTAWWNVVNWKKVEEYLVS